MKQVFFCVILLLGFSNKSLCQGYSNWASEKQQSFINNATSLIDQIFPKLVSKEGWFFDTYRKGAIEINNVESISNDKVVLTGYFGFNSSSKGKMKATAKIMGYTIIITELCNKHDGSCHESSDWGSTTFSSGSASSTSSSSNNSSYTNESKTCPDCNGGGLCSRCGRTGIIKCDFDHDSNGDGHCTHCNNTGRRSCYKCSGKGACTRCKGSGKI
jgi:hypothetical protein